MTLPAADLKVIEERWDKIREDVQNRWPQLDQTDLEMIDGDSRKLIALVHQRTGAGVPEIEDAIDELASSSHGLLDRVVKTAAAGAAAVSEQVQQSASDVHQIIDDTVCCNPGRSLGIAFGTAFALGFLMSCCGSAPKSRRSDISRWFRS